MRLGKANTFALPRLFSMFAPCFDIGEKMRADDFSRLEINLPNCISNYKYFRSILEPDTKMLVLVKANAYGHGAVEFASMMESAGADFLAVAYPIEGVELRQAGKAGRRRHSSRKRRISHM